MLEIVTVNLSESLPAVMINPCFIGFLLLVFASHGRCNNTEITETMHHSKSLNPLLLYIKVKVAQVDSTLSI